MGDECTNCVFVGYGAECPECGDIREPSHTLDFQSTLDRLYGTSYAPVYDVGLGADLHGKGHREKLMKEMGVRPKEKGEKVGKSTRKERWKKIRKGLDREKFLRSLP